MSGGDRLFRPSERGRRDPISNEKQNGRITNPPRYPEIGGMSSSRKSITKNNMTIRRPGDTSK